MTQKAIFAFTCASALLAAQSTGPDQTMPGAGNSAAAAIALDSAMVQSSYQFLQRQLNLIQDSYIRSETLDALTNPGTCITSRANLTDAQKTAIIKALMDQGLINPP